MYCKLSTIHAFLNAVLFFASYCRHLKLLSISLKSRSGLAAQVVFRGKGCFCFWTAVSIVHLVREVDGRWCSLYYYMIGRWEWSSCMMGRIGKLGVIFWPSTVYFTGTVDTSYVYCLLLSTLDSGRQLIVQCSIIIVSFLASQLWALSSEPLLYPLVISLY